MSQPPKRYKDFKEHYPKVAQAYEQLGSSVHAQGPLDDKTRALIKVAISVGGKMEGAVHSHVRKAVDAGAVPEELHQIALLAIPTIGFPSAMAAMTWIDDVLLGTKK